MSVLAALGFEWLRVSLFFFPTVSSTISCPFVLTGRSISASFLSAISFSASDTIDALSTLPSSKRSTIRWILDASSARAIISTGEFSELLCLSLRTLYKTPYLFACCTNFFKSFWGIEKTFSSLPDLIILVSRALPLVLCSCFKTETSNIATSFAADPDSFAATSKPSSESLTTCSAASPPLVITARLLSLCFFFLCNDLFKVMPDFIRPLQNVIAQAKFLAELP